MNSRKRMVWIALALALAVFTAGCSFNFSTAKIEEAIMTDMVDADGKPGNTVTSFSADAQVLYTSAKILNAPDNTKIRIVWTYLTGNQLIDSIELDSGDISDRYIYSNLTPTATLPLGDYQVQYFIEDRKEADATVNFTVVEAQAQTGSTSTDVAGEVLVYSQKEGGFSFQYPSDWTIQEFPEDLAAWVYPASASVEGEDDLNTVYVFANKGTASSYTIDTLSKPGSMKPRRKASKTTNTSRSRSIQSTARTSRAIPIRGRGATISSIRSMRCSSTALTSIR